jgi:uncharacterized protein YjbJ (UPF0337 family)
MNPNQIGGTAKHVVGRVQQKIGEMTGNTSQQVKGSAKQVEGKLQKEVGDVTRALKDADRNTHS